MSGVRRVTIGHNVLEVCEHYVSFLGEDWVYNGEDEVGVQTESLFNPEHVDELIELLLAWKSARSRGALS